MPTDKAPAVLSGDVTAGGMLNSLPSWAKSVVVILTLVPISVAVSGQILGVRAGELIEKYLEIQFEAMRGLQTEATTKILTSITDQNKTIDAINIRLEAVEDRVEVINNWACAGLSDHPPPEEDCP